MANQVHDEITYQLVEELSKLLATFYVYTAKVQYYHWNYEGNEFLSVHEFLGDVYATSASAIDAVAERIRVLGTYRPV
jgi:starvation-inducible DNA-binding protein